MKNSSKWLTGTLAALCGVLLVLCIVLAAGWGRAAKNTAVLPEVRNNGAALSYEAGFKGKILRCYGQGEAEAGAVPAVYKL